MHRKNYNRDFVNKDERPHLLQMCGHCCSHCTEDRSSASIKIQSAGIVAEKLFIQSFDTQLYFIPIIFPNCEAATLY
jgi:hypothetical protein